MNPRPPTAVSSGRLRAVQWLVMSRSRIRRIAKCTGLVTGAGLAVMMFGSTWWEVKRQSEQVKFTILDGGLAWAWTIGDEVGQPRYDGFDMGWFVRRSDRTRLRLWFRYRLYNWGSRYWHYSLFIPLWVPILTIAIPTVWLWRRDRRHPPGHCRNCGYDLTGNVTGVCSECGMEAEE